MKIQSAIAKGKLLEDFIVDRLRITGLDLRAYRQRGSGNGLMKGDVWNDLNICFEAKNTKNFSISDFYKQATRESLGTQEPVVVWHPPHQPIDNNVVVMSWEYFEKLLLKTKQPVTVNPDRAFKWKLERVKQSIKELLKEFKE